MPLSIAVSLNDTDERPCALTRSGMLVENGSTDS